jgi:CxxC motif-containing protein (DUF1111 family)
MTRCLVLRIVVPLLALISGQRAPIVDADTRPNVQSQQAGAGEELFRHEWTPGDPLARGGDGLGPVYNATSCAACHKQGGLGGAGPIENNVMMGCKPNPKTGEMRRSVIHSFATREEFRETLSHLAPGLPSIGASQLRDLSRRAAASHGLPAPCLGGVTLTDYSPTALFGAGLIDALPDSLILANERRQRLRRRVARDNEASPVGRAPRLASGRVGKFGRKGQISTLSIFVRSACANELGLGNSSHAQPVSLAKTDYRSPRLDLTDLQCDQITLFVASLPRPTERLPGSPKERSQATSGKTLFHTIGCAECHVADLGGIKGLYSDLLLHRMGHSLAGDGFYADPDPDLPVLARDLPQDDEWRTPPLWGVADSAPYLHDGRAVTLSEAIRLHGGESERASVRFAQLSESRKAELLAFLKTLRAPL